MKIKISAVCFLFFCILFSATFSFGAGDAAVKIPSAFVLNSSFEHPTVPEGVEITHDFIIQNKGAAPLNVKKVRTD